MGKYRLSLWADQDYEAILAYTLDQWGELQLKKYDELMLSAFRELTKNPLLPFSRTRDDLFPGCRLLRVGQHYVLYRSKDGIIEIARILHVQRELQQHIPKHYT